MESPKAWQEKRRVWRKLHLAVDAATHAIIAAEVSLETVADNEVFPSLLNPLRRKIEQVSADGAYDTKACHALLKKKGPRPLSHRRKNAALWEEGHPALNEASPSPLRRESWRSGSAPLATISALKPRQPSTQSSLIGFANRPEWQLRRLGEALAWVKSISRMTGWYACTTIGQLRQKSAPEGAAVGFGIVQQGPR